MNSKSGIIRKLIFMLSLIIFVYSSSVIVYKLVDSYKSKNLYKSIRKAHNDIDYRLNREENEILYDTFFFSPEKRRQEEIQKLIDEEKYEEAERLAEAQRLSDAKRREEEKRLAEEKKQALISSLKKTNTDFVGWISIENTNVNYPVVRGKDNAYYLDHDVNKRISSHGSIFMDYRNNVTGNSKLEGQNIVVYGHMMQDGSMFHDVNLYKSQYFFKDHPIITLEIFPNSYKFQVFSAYVTSPDFNYIQTNFSSKNEFNNFLNEIKKKSRFSSSVALNAKDTLLTLSTCGYEFDNARIAVHAKLIK